MDLIRIVESAYTLDGGQESWLRGLLDAMSPMMDHGFGSYGYFFDQRAREGVRLGPIVGTGEASKSSFLEILVELNQAIPAHTHHLLYNSTVAITTMSEIVAECGVDAIAKLMATYPLPSRMHDSIGLIACNPSGSGVFIGFPLPSRARKTTWEKRRWGYVSAHIAAGLRLRRSMSDVSEDGDAILDAGGRCLHAEQTAKSRSAREVLQGAARAMDRSRGKLRRTDPDEAIELWRGLVSGRWSLVDRFDSDGRRFIVARRNEPHVADPRALTARERQVAAYAAMGRSNKLIAYTLGLSSSTVATHLAKAMAKLGVRTRVELIEHVTAMRTASCE